MNEPHADIEPETHTNLLHMSRPVLVGVLAICIAICTWVLYTYGPVEWSHFRRLLGGTVLGVWCFLCVFINRVLIST